MTRLHSVLLVATAFMAAFQQQGPETKNFSIKKLAPGIWAAIQNDNGGHAISNSGIVDLGNKTLVFDAFINPDAAAELKHVAEQLTKHHVSFVINSHYHDDHIRGNQVFSPAASIISTEWTKNEMKKAEPEEQDWARKHTAASLEAAKQKLKSAAGSEKEEAIMWVGYYEAIEQSLPHLRTTLPDITFHDSMWIYGSERNVLLVECRNGHTASDAVMILPQEGIAFMGDVLFVERHPWFGDGNPESLKKHLEDFYQNASLKQFVPGHGPVAGKQALQTLIQYINSLQHLAADAIQKGEPDSVFTKRDVLPEYKDWWYGRFYPDNLEAVYMEAKMKK